jgi:ankyrin repeat protein
VSLKNNCNQTALQFATLWLDIPIDLFRIILEKTADVNAQDENGCTALHGTFQKKFGIVLRELLNHKDVDVNLKDNDYCTALQLASSRKNVPVDLFKLILEKSTDVNAQEIDGLTALHISIIHESKSALEELLNLKDVDVNLKINQNQTVLHLATLWENMPIDLFTKILEKSTDVNAQIKGGQTALHLATFKQSTIHG